MQINLERAQELCDWLEIPLDLLIEIEVPDEVALWLLEPEEGERAN